MPTIEETVDAIVTESQSPDFQGLGQNEQGLVIRQLLGQSEEFSGLGPADQAAILNQTFEALQAGPVQKGAGEFAQEVGMEMVVPTVTGMAGTALGGIPGGAIGAMLGGQAAEFTRPALAGEPLRPLEEQLTRRAVEGAFSVGADLATRAIGKAAVASSNFVRNAIKRSLGLGEAVSPEVAAAQRVAQRAGAELVPFQARGEAPGGVLSTLETVALNSFGGENIVARRAAQQVSAAQAYADELSDAYVRSLTSDELAGFITNAVANRKAAATQMRRALYGQLNNATPGVRIDITDLVDDLRQFQGVETFEKALGGAMPEAFVAAPAGPTGAQVITGVGPSGEPIFEAGVQTLTPTLGDIANRISRLRATARTTKNEGVANWANRTANELNRRAVQQMPQNAVPLWESARGFAGAEADLLRNQLLTSIVRQAQQKPDGLIKALLRPGAGDTAVALKNALDQPLVGPGGQVVPGTNRWKEIVQPAITNSLLDTIVDKSGNIVGGKLLTQLRGFSKKQVDDVLGRGTFNALRDLGSALEVAAKRPTEKGVFLIRGQQAQAGQTGLAATLGTLGVTGTIPPAAAALGAGATLVGPAIFAKIITNPALTKKLAQVVKVPGKNFTRLTQFLTRMAALSTEEDVSRAALGEALDILGQVRETKGQAFIPPGSPRR